MPYTSELIDLATQLAAVAHRDQVRKGNQMPYIVHPIAVGMILLRAGCDDEVIAAGILHDTVEDTDVTIVDIEQQFGRRVAHLVWGASEPDKSQEWEQRKEHTLSSLKSASPEQRILVCADKLHNVISIARDLDEIGESVWNRFSRGKDKQEWYYRNIVESLGWDGDVKVLNELRVAVDALFGTTRSMQIPNSMKPSLFFDIVFRNVNKDSTDSAYEACENEPMMTEYLDAIHKLARKMRRDAESREMSEMASYLSQRGVEFDESETARKLLSISAAVKQLLGLYNYQLWPHIKRGLKRGILKSGQ